MRKVAPHPTKFLTRLLIGGLLCVVLYFAFYQPDYINIEGEWTIDTIVLNGKKTLPTEGSKNTRVVFTHVTINSWSKTLVIHNRNQEIPVRFTYLDDRYTIQLNSREKAFNGLFRLELDTLSQSENFFDVFLKINSEQTQIALKRTVYIPPFKPQKIRRGMP
jgi:hypothetical protein